MVSLVSRQSTRRNRGVQTGHNRLDKRHEFALTSQKRNEEIDYVEVDRVLEGEGAECSRNSNEQREDGRFGGKSLERQMEGIVGEEFGSCLFGHHIGSVIAEQEYQALQQLAHVTMINTKDVVQTGGDNFVVQLYVDGNLSED